MATYTAPVIVYGATEAAINAACAARREGVPKVLLLIDAEILNNYSAQCLGRADIGKSRCIGGMYRTQSRKIGNRVGWYRSFPAAPSDASDYYWQQLGFWGVDVVRNEQVVAVAKTGASITSMTMESGNVYVATKCFIDGSLMGDVMMRALPFVPIADVTDTSAGWTVGMESKTAFNESLGGFKHSNYPFAANIRDGAGNLRNGVTPDPGLAVGSAWAGIACPGVRTTVTDDRSRMFSWSRIIEDMTYPYVKDDYVFDASFVGTTGEFSPSGITQGKYDLNSIVILTDPVTQQPLHHTYHALSYADRTTVRTKILNHMRGRLYYTAVEPEHAGVYQTSQARFGVPRDEFTATRRFTTGLPYFREGPRMLGEYVMAQQDCTVMDTSAPRHYLKPDPICLGSYSLDLKPTAFLTIAGQPGMVLKEGDGGSDPARQIATDGYQVPYRAILPKAAQCNNLFVVYCASWTHVAWGSGRIICTNAMMGEAAGIAAGIAYATSVLIHDVPYPALNAKLLSYDCKLVPTATEDPEEPEEPTEPETPGGGG